MRIDDDASVPTYSNGRLRIDFFQAVLAGGATIRKCDRNTARYRPTVGPAIGPLSEVTPEETAHYQGHYRKVKPPCGRSCVP